MAEPPGHQDEREPPSPPIFSMFTLREPQSRGQRPNARPPQIEFTFSAQLNMSVSSISSPRPSPARPLTRVSSMGLLPYAAQPRNLPSFTGSSGHTITPPRGPAFTHPLEFVNQRHALPPATRLRSGSGPALGQSRIHSSHELGGDRGTRTTRGRRVHASISQLDPGMTEEEIALCITQTPPPGAPQTLSPLKSENMQSSIAQTPSPEAPQSSTPSRLDLSSASGPMVAHEDTSTKDDRCMSTLTLAEATHMLNATTHTGLDTLQTLPSLSVSVAIYSPFGSFLPPLHPLILTQETCLRSLILTLQDQLVVNLTQSGSLAKLLVQSIEVRVFDCEGMEALPRIEGFISAENEGNTLLSNMTKWVAWDATGGEGETEKFWHALLRKLLVDVMSRGDKEGGRSPMLKVRTIVKVNSLNWLNGELVGDLTTGGGHMFRVPAGAVLPSPPNIASTVITPLGSIAAEGGKGPATQAASIEDRSSALESGSDSLSQASTPERSREVGSAEKPVASASSSQSQSPKIKEVDEIHDNQRQTTQPSLMAPTAVSTDIAAAEELLRTLGLSDAAQQMKDEINQQFKIEPTETQVNKKNKEMARYTKTVGGANSHQPWVQKGGYPKDAPVDPENNWEKFQTWGEKPSDPGYENRQALHKAFSLRHVPFDGPPCEPWATKEKMPKYERDEEGKVKMVPFVELDAGVVEEKILEEQNKPENQPEHIKAYWAEQERIKGMTEIDDDTFFPASNPEFVREEANKVFAAKEFKNPGRAKYDIRSKLSGATERRSSQHSGYLNSLAADGPSMYDNMSTPDTIHFSPSTTFNQSHAAADNVFTSSLQNMTSFSSLAKQNTAPAPRPATFLELSQGVANHTPAKDTDAFIALFQKADKPGGHAGDNRRQRTPTSFTEFNSMAHDFAQQRPAGGFANPSTVPYGHDNNGYTTMGGGGTMGDGMANGSMGNMMTGGGIQSGSLDAFSGVAAGGPSDFRGIVSHGIHQPAGFPNQQGWTSMNNGPTFNSFGTQSASFDPRYRTTADTTHNRAMGTFPQFNQSGLPTPTPVGRAQSRFFNPMDSGRSAPGSERFAFNNNAGPTNSHQPGAGSFVHGGGPARARTHGLHAGSNTAASSRLRRPVPIMPPSSLAGGAMAFQLPSPTRQAINYGAGPSAPSGFGAPGNAPAPLRRTPSPEKKPYDAAFNAALANAFNGHKGF